MLNFNTSPNQHEVQSTEIYLFDQYLYMLSFSFSVSPKKMNSIKIKTLMRTIYVFLIIFIGILSVIPDGIENKMSDSYSIFKGGYIFHILAYLIICFVGLLNNFHQRYRPAPVIAFILVYSIILEAIQYLLPYRTFNLYDILSNFIGITIGWFIFTLYRNWNLKLK